MEEKRNALKKGDKIVVAGGILGEVVRVQQDTVIVKLEEGAKMEVMKGAIQDIVKPSVQENEPVEKAKE